jgi:hypothetical protein
MFFVDDVRDQLKKVSLFVNSRCTMQPARTRLSTRIVALARRYVFLPLAVGDLVDDVLSCHWLSGVVSMKTDL